MRLALFDFKLWSIPFTAQVSLAPYVRVRAHVFQTRGLGRRPRFSAGPGCFHAGGLSWCGWFSPHGSLLSVALISRLFCFVSCPVWFVCFCCFGLFLGFSHNIGFSSGFFLVSSASCSPAGRRLARLRPHCGCSSVFRPYAFLGRSVGGSFSSSSLGSAPSPRSRSGGLCSPEFRRLAPSRPGEFPLWESAPVRGSMGLVHDGH